MLVLTRKSGEAIVLNQIIRIRILSVDDGRVRIGIDAPPDVVVVREELLEEDHRHVIPPQRYAAFLYIGARVQLADTRGDAELAEMRGTIVGEVEHGRVLVKWDEVATPIMVEVGTLAPSRVASVRELKLEG